MNFAVLAEDYYNDYKLAEKLYKRAIKINKNSGPAHFYYAQFLSNRLNDQKKAQKHFKKAEELGFSPYQ